MIIPREYTSNLYIFFSPATTGRRREKEKHKYRLRNPLADFEEKKYEGEHSISILK